MPGDAEKQTEREILAENSAEALRADVLKIGHHGGKNSSVPDFLATVQPRIAIISAGSGNHYGNPSQEVLAQFASLNVRMIPTARDGAVQVLTDGKTLDISCFVACADSLSTASMHSESPHHQEQTQQQQKP